MKHYYYADTDSYGVLCVDRIEDSTSETSAVNLARYYPNTIYFHVEDES